MSESWRRKTYYPKRVLIDTARVLDPQFEGGLLCITGAQLEILRNLTQYLHRRSTFAAGYQTDYYLAPTEEEWDSLQAIVADLEETLMGCEELTAALEAMAVQLACVCESLKASTALTQPYRRGYVDQPSYDDYVSPTEQGVGDPPGGLADWDAFNVAKCIGAQKMVDDAVMFVDETGAQMALGILATFTYINGVLLLTVISMPIAVMMQVVTTFVVIGATYVYGDVVDWLEEHKEGIVCAIYNADTAATAYSAVNEHIVAGWDAGPGIEMVKQLFNFKAISDIFDHTQRDYDDWSGDYDADYCDACEEIPEGVDFTWTWPPCPATHHIDGGVCSSGRLSFHGGIDDAHQNHDVTDATYNRVTIEIRWRSAHPNGWSVGGVGVDWWDSVGEEWDLVAHFSATNSEDAGDLNTDSETFELGPPQAGGLTRSRLHGQPGQGEEDPYSFEVEYVRLTYFTV